MFRFLKNDNASALAMTLIVMLVLTILGTVILNISIAENKFANRNEDKLQAYYIARSGAQSVAEYMVKDNKNDASNMIGYVSNENSQIGGGSFSVSVMQDPSDLNSIDIISTGTYKDITQTAKIVVTKTSIGIGSLFDHAIVAQNNISISNNSGEKTEIIGTVATIDGNIVLEKATAEKIITNAEILLPVIELPASSEYNQVFGNVVRTNSDGDLNLPAASHVPAITETGIREYFYYATGLDLKKAALNIVDNTGLPYKDAKPNVVVHFYIEGDISVDTNAMLTSDESAFLYIYVKGKHTVTFTGAGKQNNVYIYAPESDIIWNNAQTKDSFVGGLVGYNVTLTNQLTIVHNKNLKSYSDLDTTNVGINYTGYKWID